MKIFALAPLSVLAIGVLSACAPTTPTFDRNFGEASRVLRAQQVHDTQAPVANRHKLPDGIDGRAARESYERYQRSFTSPPRSNVFTIGVSGADSGEAPR